MLYTVRYIENNGVHVKHTSDVVQQPNDNVYAVQHVLAVVYTLYSILTYTHYIV